MAESKIPQIKTNKKYKDAPRFPLIYKYEGNFKSTYDKFLKDGVRAFSSKYKEIIENQKEV